ncbi:MAG: NADPH-dependent F420 reductase [Chloroflexi bacterium]|nr:NADPH-dependent F420 reductase [Chloroflexota bacterium]
MRIGILGAGNVGGNLGKAWATQGHDVFFGVRDPRGEKVRALLATIGSQARAGNPAEAVAFGEVIVLAVSWAGVAEVLRQAGDLTGKIVVDATNRLAPPTPGSAPSAGEEVARLAPGARVVKAFNSIGAELLAGPQFGDQRPSMFICGDDAAAKTTVAQLADQIGFDVVDAGSLANAGLLESLAVLWIRLSRSEGRDIAFKLLRR